MRFISTPLQGAFVIELEPHGDERGFFARLFCQDTFAQRGLEATFVQANDSLSAQKGTLRGLHFQLPPQQETKVVRCVRGSLYDVIVDLRRNSPTFGQAFGETLSADNRKMMYVPKGFAHGFLTLEDHTEVLYLVSEFYSKELERGIRWNDPFFSINWPDMPKVVSERDQSYSDFDPHLLGGVR